MDNSLLIEAKKYRDNNISVMPIKSDGKNPTLDTWTPYKLKLIDKKTFIKGVERGGDGLAVICGYNDIEVIDVDCKYDLTGKLWDNLRESIYEHLPEVLDSLIVKTVGGGYHIYYKCETKEGNKKLASRPTTETEKLSNSKENVKVLIETREFGGYVCAPPTVGYKVVSGSIENIIVITKEQRETLFNICRSFDEVPKKVEIIKNKEDKGLYSNENSPFKDFDKRGDAITILQQHGWTVTRVCGERIFMLRPGDTKSKTSGNFHTGLNVFYVFTSSSEFEPNKGYGPASIYVILECNGNPKVAYRKLLDEGYGEKYKNTTYNESNVVEQFNKDYAVVDCNGSVEIWKISVDENGQKKESRYKTSDFKMMFSNQKINVDDKNIPITTLWINSPNRRQYKSVVFKPGQKLDEYIYNFWSGFTCDNIPGDCSKYLRHIKEVIAENDSKIYEYILDWMADAVQNLQFRPGVALIIRGDQGVGKGVFIDNFGKLFGRHYLHITDSNSLVNKFNSLLEGKCIVFADEAFWGRDKLISGKLKGIITERELQIERKGNEAYSSNNFIRLIAASNNDIVVPVEKGDRRFFVVEAQPTYKGNYKYFEDIEDEMANGGRNALLDILLKRDISTKSIKNFPKTKALTDQKASNLDDIEQFVVSLLEAGSFKELMKSFPIFLIIDGLKNKDTWEEKVLTKDLFSLYTKWCDSEKVKYPTKNKSLFSRKIRKIFMMTKRSRVKQNDALELPDLAKCKEMFNFYLGSDYFETEEEIRKDAEQMVQEMVMKQAEEVFKDEY